jgi:outer membrane protein assembly factor BamB
VNTGNTIQAINESDGTSVWNYDVAAISLINNDGAQDPAVYDGRVYFAGGHQSSTYLFALDAVTGAVQSKSLMSSQWERYFAPVAQGGDVYTEGGTYSGLYGFDNQGAQLFFVYTEQMDRWSPAVDPNYVYTYTGWPGGAAYMRQINRFTGAVVRSIQDPTFKSNGYRMNTAPVLTATGGVLTCAQYVSLTRFDLANGVISWQQTGNYGGNPALANGVIYAINRSPYRLEARDELTGQLKWAWTPQSARDTDFVGDVMVTQNLVFLSTNTATYAIDLTTHQVAWNYAKPGLLALSSSGLLYLSTTDAYGQSDGTILAFNTH